MATASVSSELEALSMSESNIVVVPWLDLPDYLTEKILERLHIFDYIIFGAICRRWRSIQTAHRLHHAPAPPPVVNLPCFIPHRPKQESVICFVGLFHDDLNHRRSERPLHIPLSPVYLKYLHSKEAATEAGGEEDCVPDPASSSLPFGWLLVDDWPQCGFYERMGHGYDFTLLNPITGVQIQLPNLGTLYNDFKATMSPPPRCDIFVITSDRWGIKLHLYRQGNPDWISVDYSYEDFYCGVFMSMASAIHYKGKFYCLFLGKGLMVVEDGITSHFFKMDSHYFEMDQSQLPKMDFGEVNVDVRLECFLVESNGKMLMVLEIFEYDPSCTTRFTTRTLERFELFEADFLNRRWVKMESLGDQSLFIYRNFVVSLLAADVGVKENCIHIIDVGVKENCIHFIDPPADEPTTWSVFDFGTGMLVADVSLTCPPLPSTHLMFVPSIY